MRDAILFEVPFSSAEAVTDRTNNGLSKPMGLEKYLLIEESTNEGMMRWRILQQMAL